MVIIIDGEVPAGDFDFVMLMVPATDRSSVKGGFHGFVVRAVRLVELAAVETVVDDDTIVDEWMTGTIDAEGVFLKIFYRSYVSRAVFEYVGAPRFQIERREISLAIGDSRVRVAFDD